ncbi:MAG: Glucosaminyl phosphatidylinositol (GlcN-PI) nositol acylation protein [Chaenotheca gracillima]|nr:MAG: Glucosaminyl phosphatidylinositol (GlcN-PI) nositol acylation protein [Chaenotheca gracillima]
MANSYKSLKEDFVSNLTGGEISEINIVTAVAPYKASTLLWAVLQSRFSFFTPYTPAAIVTDFLLNVVAILLAITVYSSAPILLNVLLASAAAVVYFLPSSRGRRRGPAKPPASSPGNNGLSTTANSASQRESPSLPQKPFLTTYRGSMMVITCLAILAVDFRIFPRRFAKVETWGTSLMDLGVGSFVFSAGLVSARPVLKERLLPPRSGTRAGFGQRLFQSIQHSLPLLALGVIRLYSVKNLDYAEHVSEYGVHWNFFFTLGFLPPFAAVLHSVSSLIPSYALLSLLVGGGYQCVLSFHPTLQPYILLAPRNTGLFSQNREGILSFFGYLSIFLGGLSTGLYVLPSSQTIAASSGRTDNNKKGASFFSKTYMRIKASLAMRLIIWSLLWVTLHHFSTDPRHGLSLTTSRRLANLPYVLWVNAFNTTQLLAFYAVERFCFPSSQPESASSSSVKESNIPAPRVSPLLTAFNNGGLIVFLVANLLTGAVNMSFRTLEMDSLSSIALLLGYSAILAATSLGKVWWSRKQKTTKKAE